MSTHAVRLAEISLTAAEARRNAPVVTSWLLDRGVITPNPDRDLMAGDLEGLWSFHIGDLAVVFHNWPPPHEEFAAALGAVMSPRTHTVIERL